MVGIGPGADSVAAIVNTVVHLAHPSRFGEQYVFGTPPPADPHISLVHG